MNHITIIDSSRSIITPIMRRKPQGYRNTSGPSSDVLGNSLIFWLII